MGPYGGYCHGGENRYGRGGPNSQWDLMKVTVMGERTGMGEVVLTANGGLGRLLLREGAEGGGEGGEGGREGGDVDVWYGTGVTLWTS